MRIVAIVFLLLVASAVGGIYFVYDTLDPCLILAKKRANDTIRDVSEGLGGEGDSIGVMDSIVLQTHRLIVNDLTTGECVEKLSMEWWDDLQSMLPDE